jgi:ketosteroid isomerase-like protein
MTRTASTGIVMAAFAAVQERDERRLAELYHPEVEFCWPPSLPYGGSARGATALQAGDRTSFDQIWDPLQPTRHERRMDPRVVAGTDQEVVVPWHQPRRPVSAGRTSQQATRQDLFLGPRGPNRCVSLACSARAVR